MNKGDVITVILWGLLIGAFLIISITGCYATVAYGDYCQELGYQRVVVISDGIYCERSERLPITGRQ
jgi:hypothetical protein